MTTFFKNAAHYLKGFWLQGMANPSPVANCAIAVMESLSPDDDYRRQDDDWNRQPRFQHRDGRRRWN